MPKSITAEQFEALKLEAASIETEKDVEYGYETLLNADGEEIAFAAYHSFREPTFTLVCTNA